MIDLNSAIERHSSWKVKLRSAITNQETVDASSAAKDNCCELGKWLHGEGKASFGALPSFGGCVSQHASFHREVGKIAAMINAGQFSQAEALLGFGTPYQAASSAVGVAIRTLKKEAGL
ncbi:CZB domain-containing protein [Dyella ginsengisoli]|uniref:CZB domain-containing protein n=1 Tax=Dyella ginsengisoli TaxID=363848 RepID=UPI000349E856|nr:CZB domain-containing protein [Dyella ginsengisoli]